MFSQTGLSTEATIMSTDNASYYKSTLTRLFLMNIGVSPRFHTPYASWSTGLVERHLQTVKRIPGKLTAESPSKWHDYLPYNLWAMRERVSNPLHLQPFELVTGRKMKGPLSILRESWLGYRDLPISLGKRTEDFLREVQDGLKTAESYADLHRQAVHSTGCVINGLQCKRNFYSYQPLITAQLFTRTAMILAILT